MREHIKTHAGEMMLAVPIQPLDHLDRAPSLLHHRISSAGMSIATTLTQTTFANKKSMNAILKKYGQAGVSPKSPRSMINDRRAMTPALYLRGMVFLPSC
eukprot:3646634-Pleurochrysis_carterae.AAC.1